jgi:hypothetical protein
MVNLYISLLLRVQLCHVRNPGFPAQDEDMPDSLCQHKVLAICNTAAFLCLVFCHGE